MKVLFVSAYGSGFADDIEVEEGITAKELFAKQLGDASPSNFSIRVNGERVSGSYVMKEGDRMTVVPCKVAGA